MKARDTSSCILVPCNGKETLIWFPWPRILWEVHLGTHMVSLLASGTSRGTLEGSETAYGGDTQISYIATCYSSVIPAPPTCVIYHGVYCTDRYQE